MPQSAKLISNNFLLVLCIAFVSIASGQTIRGKVTDTSTGEPLVGATVSLEHTKFNTIANLNGSYVFKNVPAGKYEVKVKYSGSKYSYTPCVAYNGAAAVNVNPLISSRAPCYCH